MCRNTQQILPKTEKEKTKQLVDCEGSFWDGKHWRTLVHKEMGSTEILKEQVIQLQNKEQDKFRQKIRGTTKSWIHTSVLRILLKI